MLLLLWLLTHPSNLMFFDNYGLVLPLIGYFELIVLISDVDSLLWLTSSE